MPAAGSVVILTAAKALAGVSLGSVNPKSAAAKVWSRPPASVTVPSVPAGSVVDRGDVEGQRVGARVQVDAAVGGAAVVRTLKLKLA